MINVSTGSNQCYEENEIRAWGWEELGAVVSTETVGRLLKKFAIKLPYDLAVPLLGIYLKELKSGY